MKSIIRGEYEIVLERGCEYWEMMLYKGSKCVASYYCYPDGIRYLESAEYQANNILRQLLTKSIQDVLGDDENWEIHKESE